jgi:hypothetical protein
MLLIDDNNWQVQQHQQFSQMLEQSTLITKNDEEDNGSD